MSLFGAISGAMTSGIDLFIGGQLTMAELQVEDKKTSDTTKLEFQFNPETIKISRAQATTKTSVPGTADKRADQNAVPETDSIITLSNVIFDTYEDKPFGNVYEKYICKLEKFVTYDQHKHAPPELVFTWGKFSSSFTGNQRLKVKLDNLDVEYTMFLNDATPVRAKVNMTLRLGLRPDEQQKTDGQVQSSPDHAKLVTVKRGETLSDIAAFEYDNPGEWRRIANANEIDDPMNVTPGTQLIVPPILK